jgi:hypothetical protein
MKNQFNQEFKEFLADRSDAMDYSRSGSYRKFDERTEELYGVIKAALPEDLHWELAGLDDSYGGRQAAAANLSYQEGFMQGARFLLDILSNNADLSPELPEVALKRDDHLIIHQPGEDPDAPDISNALKREVRCIFIRINGAIHCIPMGKPITKREARLLYLEIQERLTHHRAVIIRNSR